MPRRTDDAEMLSDGVPAWKGSTAPDGKLWTGRHGNDFDGE